jgi:hypothetical protein
MRGAELEPCSTGRSSIVLGAHLGYDYLVGQPNYIDGGLGGATLVFYLAVSLGVQRVIVGLCARRLVPAAPGAMTP